MLTNDKNERAVSPVVGVMLMLVVTIIIAAVVSAFAGGLGQASKVPQVSIGAEVHNNQNIIIDFKGGDTLNGGAISLKTYIPSGTFKDMNHQVNLSDSANVIYLNTGFGLNNCTTDSYGYTSCKWYSIQPGDKVEINWAAAFAASSYGGYIAPDEGEPVEIEIFDSASGKQIATTQANILP